MQTTFIGLVILSFTLLYFCNKATESTECKLIMAGSLVFLVYCIFTRKLVFSQPDVDLDYNSDDSDIEPYKSFIECPCAAGSNGRDLTFEYTSDAQRLQCNNEQNKPKTAQQMLNESCGC